MTNIRREEIKVWGNHEEAYKASLNNHPNLPAEVQVHDYNAEEYGNGHLNSAEAETWVGLHEVGYQPALTELLSTIRRVTFAEFKKQLEVSIKSCFPQFGVDSRETYREFLKNTVVLVENKNSNQWVAELAKKYVGFAASNYYRLGEKDAREFTSHIRNFAKADEIERLKGKVLVLFDDGSYSGKQIYDHVVNLLNLKKEKTLNFDRVCVIVPYMTDRSRTMLADLAAKTHRVVGLKEGSPSLEDTDELGSDGKQEKVEKTPVAPVNEDADSDVIVADSSQIHTVAESVTEEHAALLTKLWWSKESRTEGPHSKGIMWFDHKIPNDQSFIGAIEKGNVINPSRICRNTFKLIPQIEIPYKK
jgi:hypothetical protein